MSLSLVSDTANRPLILDVDGTLIKSDLTHEMILEAIKRNPARALHYAKVGAKDKPAMKADMVARIGDRFAFANLPLEPKIVALAHEARRAGRKVYLCSGSEKSLVERLAEELDFIDGAFGTTLGYNMTSENKAAFLTERFPDGFDYAGNSTQDFAVWKAAQRAYGVRPPKGTDTTRTAADKAVTILEPRQRRFGPLLRTLRPVMWPAALISALPGLYHAMRGINTDWSAVGWTAVCAVPLLGALAISDDLADIQRDRRRSDMRDRPLAAGNLSVPSAVMALLGLLMIMTGLSAVTLNPWATAWLLGTFVLGIIGLRYRGPSALFATSLFIGLSLLGLGLIKA